MTREELMVGDYFALIDFNGPTRITAIYDDVVQLQENYKSEFDEEWYSEAYIKDLKPIPLTTEILEKNGFDISDKEVMQYHFEEDGEKYHFSLRQMYDKDGKPHGYSFYAFNVLTLLDYVHELQHAMRLCGINKEIEI